MVSSRYLHWAYSGIYGFASTQTEDQGREDYFLQETAWPPWRSASTTISDWASAPFLNKFYIGRCSPYNKFFKRKGQRRNASSLRSNKKEASLMLGHGCLIGCLIDIDFSTWVHWICTSSEGLRHLMQFYHLLIGKSMNITKPKKSEVNNESVCLLYTSPSPRD